MDFIYRIFDSFLWPWLVGSIPTLGGVAAAVIKKRNWPWATPIAYGVVVGVALLVAIVAIGFASERAQRTTPENIEARIRDWSDRLGYGIKRDRSKSDGEFRYELEVGLIKVNLIRLKNENLVRLRGRVDLAGDAKALFDALPAARQRELVKELRMEFLRLHFDYIGLGVPLQTFEVEATVPVNKDLNEQEFLRATDDLKRAVFFTRELIQLRVVPSKK